MVRPDARAVTFPLFETVAMLSSSLLQKISSLDDTPYTLNVFELPASNVIAVLLIYCFGTVTLQVYVFFPAFALILAVPAFFAVTSPNEFTDATDLLLLDHFTFALVFFSVRLDDRPIVSVSFVLFSFGFGFACEAVEIFTNRATIITNDSSFRYFFLFIDKVTPLVKT